jgi:DMSO/TMAO reductase YedYZ molybdopterin-dependent catalytic subunit
VSKDDDGVGFLGRIKDKLIDSKRKWARDGRLLTGSADLRRANRLPPGQRLVQNWPVLDLGVQPDIPTSIWRVTIDGLVENPTVWKWGEFTDEPMVKCRSDIHCVTAWSRYDNDWEGVSARHILSVVKPKPEARHVIFHAYDTYTTNVPIEAFDDDDTLLAIKWHGEPISQEHGGPVRVVIPKLYFWKSAKWIKRIEFSEIDKPGFWEVRGYHNNGDPWLEERYDTET